MFKITSYRKSDADFYDWLEEPVYWGEGSNQQITRATAIARFVKYGLYPFVESRGYVWGCTLDNLKNKIATGLYENMGKHYLNSRWDYESYNNDYTNEELWHFEAVIREDDWVGFWSVWACWCDVDPSTERGLDRQADIQRFCWTQIRLDKSPQVNILMDYIRNAEYEDHASEINKSKREDTYLREAAESNQWDGWRR